MKEKDINEIDVLKQAAVTCGLDEKFVNNCISDMTTDPVKNRLRSYTDEALNAGELYSQ